jgi:Fe-S cluster assembly protein SufD
VTAPFRPDLRDPETFPTRRVEDWKWTDLRRYLREAPPPSPALAVAPGGPFAALGSDELAFGNGRTAAGESDVRIEATGVLRLRFVSDATGTGHQASAHVVVPDGGDLLLLETYEGAGSAYVANTRLTFSLGADAQLTRMVLLDEPEDAISISIAGFEAFGDRASFRQTVLTRGAKLQRHETRLVHPGHGATVRLDGLYVLDGSRHADLTTVVEHAGVNGETRQLTKGVVADRGHGVFQGRIVVAQGADGTDARMGHHALVLSDRAEVDAKPELEIYADDVACAHGNTVGALDERALFYARARGIPELQARKMLTEAFLGEVVDRVGHEGAAEAARAWLSARLEAL